MVKSKTDWVEASQEQLVVEGKGGVRRGKISQDLGLDVQPALEPIPDNDWTGETWGLFWPDQEMEERSEDPTKYIKVSRTREGRQGFNQIFFIRNITRKRKTSRNQQTSGQIRPVWRFWTVPGLNCPPLLPLPLLKLS